MGHKLTGYDFSRVFTIHLTSRVATCIVHSDDPRPRAGRCYLSSRTWDKATHTRERYANTAENAFFLKARQLHWFVSKRGWPDFFCICPDGHVVLVEVKPSGKPQSLSKEQRLVLKALSRAGFDIRMADKTGQTFPIRFEDNGNLYRPMPTQAPHNGKHLVSPYSLGHTKVTRNISKRYTRPEDVAPSKGQRL